MSKHPQSVQVRVFFEDKQGVEQQVDLGAISQPIRFGDLEKRLVNRGFPDPFVLFTRPTPPYNVKVTSAPSSFNDVTGEMLINLNQPLVHFYSRIYLEAVGDIQEFDSAATSSTISKDNEVKVGGLASIGFQRTIRVPDNDKIQALPPSLGPFKLFNVGESADHLPKSVVSKGGIFLTMYQKEAMWMSFRPAGPCALKVSVGGINALTGTPQGVSEKGKQDYLPLGDAFGQLWLDGISTAPGIVRQFVAVPLGHNHTIEGQLTGRETEGGIQIDVFPRHPTSVLFTKTGEDLSLYNTPRELGLIEGDFIKMLDKRPFHGLRLGNVPGSSETMATKQPVIDFDGYNTCNPHTATSGEVMQIFIKTLTGRSITLCLRAQNTVRHVKTMIQEHEGIPPDEQLLVFAGRTLDDDKRLGHYNISDCSTIHLSMRLRGGRNIDMLGGFSVGGRISQKINKDPLPPLAYNFERGCRLYVTVINATHFTSVTGLSSPPSPVSAKTYLEHGLPWFELYDEYIPAANNTITPTPLSNVLSVSELAKRENLTQGKSSLERMCVYCVSEMSTTTLVPCGHEACDNCSASIMECPSCRQSISARHAFAAPMPFVSQDDGVEAGGSNDSVVKLKYGASQGRVTSFKLSRHAVSPLTEDWKSSKKNREARGIEYMKKIASYFGVFALSGRQRGFPFSTKKGKGKTL